MLIIRNETNKTEVALPTGEVSQHELIQIDARNGDCVTVAEVEYDLIQQGENRISGSNTYQPRMIRREFSRTVKQSGVVKRNGIRWN